MIELSHVQVVYHPGGANEVHALRDACLYIPQGTFTAVVGPSGSGKSTLLHVIGGLLKPQRGRCTVAGQELTEMSGSSLATFRNRTIGFVLQDFGLMGHATVLENVKTPMLFSAVPYREMEQRAMAALEMLGIGNLARRKAYQLSGGQCQRVAIARALVMNSPVILADEPTGALDTETARQLMEVFRELHQQGRTILMVTHNLELQSWCSGSIAIRDGIIYA